MGSCVVERVHVVPVIGGHFVGGELLAIIELIRSDAQRDGRVCRKQYAAHLAQHVAVFAFDHAGEQGSAGGQFQQMSAVCFLDQHRVAGNGDGGALDCRDSAGRERAIAEYANLDAQRVNAVDFQLVIEVFYSTNASPLAGDNHRQAAQLRPVSYSHNNSSIQLSVGAGADDVGLGDLYGRPPV